ncbi:MAG: DUF4363 family protein [Clostridiales bacterium]|nr:DUF4363 family protein [Clostridiales bacterium]
MLKTVISLICALFLLIAGELFESFFVQKQFDEFDLALQTLYLKADDEEITKEDVLAVQKNWISKKRLLHMFIPHTEIKEVDLWLSEAVSYAKSDNFEEVLSKIEVLIEMCEQIPNTFKLKPENIL